MNNARIQYYLFNVLSNNSDNYLGPNGELNYATADMLADYQHANLYTEDHLQEIADSMQYLSDYVEEKEQSFTIFNVGISTPFTQNTSLKLLFKLILNQRQMESLEHLKIIQM